MENEKSLCIVCAWRETCQKRFLKNKDISFQCPEFTKDISIKKGVTSDVKKEDSGDSQ